MSTLSEVWGQVTSLLKNGFSIIPVRDKEQTYNGKVYSAKTPCIGSWKQYQNRFITEPELWAAMEKSETSAIAILAGKISGNLEVIDVDQKQWPGIGAQIFRVLHDIYPNLFKLLRIHNTPSGGYHILYRISDGEPEGNQKLAYHIEHKEAGIETRGEGGYICAPPCIGYTVFQEMPVPIITMDQRNILIQVCRSFNQKIKVKQHKSEYTKDAYYDKNPFEHYNTSPAAAQVLSLHGWSYDGVSGPWVHYTRPGKQTGVSASFNNEKGYYYFFTTSTEFEAEKGYTPSTVRCMLECGNDYKTLHKKLVSEGYGVVNQKVQDKITHRNALTAKPLPANFSPDALAEHERLINENQEKYPYGIFWFEEDEKLTLSHERLIQVAGDMGFRVYNGDILCQVTGYTVTKVRDRYFLDCLKSYIKEDDADYHLRVLNGYEAFMKHNTAWITSRVPEIDDKDFVRSSKRESYKFYLNCWVGISAEAISPMPYELITGYVWDEQILRRDFYFISQDAYSSSVYFDYLTRAVGISDHLFKTMGYLAHDHKDEEAAYIIVLTEECPDPTQGGGSGKNIFTTLFSNITSYTSVSGTQVQYNEKFLQSWDMQRVFAIHDIPKDFKFEFIKELSSGVGVLKKLWKNEQSVGADKMPKFVLSTNFSFKITDGGLKRRIIPVEFTNFFTLSGGVRKYYNKMFPAGWDDQEWLAFDNIMCCSIQMYLQAGELEAGELSAGGWDKQFKMDYNQDTRDFIDYYMEDWLRTGDVKIDDFNRQYETFLVTAGVSLKYKLTGQRMNEALRSYCSKHRIIHSPTATRRVNSVVFKTKSFKRELL